MTLSVEKEHGRDPPHLVLGIVGLLNYMSVLFAYSSWQALAAGKTIGQSCLLVGYHNPDGVLYLLGESGSITDRISESQSW